MDKISQIRNEPFIIIAMRTDDAILLIDVGVYSNMEDLTVSDHFIKSIQSGLYEEVWFYPAPLLTLMQHDEIHDYTTGVIDKVELAGMDTLDDAFKLDIISFD